MRSAPPSLPLKLSMQVKSEKLRRKECNADTTAPAAALYLSNRSPFSHPCNLPLVALSMIHHFPNVQREEPLPSTLWSTTKKDSK